MKPKIFHPRSFKAWLSRKRRAFSSSCRRYQQRKSGRKNRGPISIVSGESIAEEEAWHAPKTRHDSFDGSSSSLTRTLVPFNDSRPVSSSEKTSCLDGTRGPPSPVQDTQPDRSSTLTFPRFPRKYKKLRRSRCLPLPESSSQSRGPHSPSLASDNQQNHPQNLVPAASNSQPGDSHAQSCISQTGIDRLVNLPYSLFLQIFCLVPPHEIVRSRQVSKTLRNTLTSQALCMSLILDFFPRAREARILQGLTAGENRSEIGDNDLDTTDWATVFARLARRYWHLSQGKPWRQSEIIIRKDLQVSHGMKPWNRFMRGHNLTADFHHWDPFWTCDPNLGLIIYPAPDSKGLDVLDFRARDIETGDECVVPFQLSGGSLIRVHVSQGVLLFAFVVKSDSGCRFFVEAFDIMKQPTLSQLSSKVYNSLREKQLSQDVFSSRGLYQLFSMDRPLGHEGRFFCTHNITHFALYKWIPTTDLSFTAVNPLEELVVWDIGTPGPGPRPERSEPRRILTHPTSTLQHLGLSQKFTPRLRSLELDNITQDDTGSACGHVYLFEDDHDLLSGPHAGPSSGVVHCVESTGLPLLGIGPTWRETCLGRAPVRGRLPFFDAHCFHPSRNTTPGLLRWQRLQSGLPPHYSCSRRLQCWRHGSFPYITVSQAHDTAAGVRFKALHFFSRKDITVSFPPGIYPHDTDEWEGNTRLERHPLRNEQLSFFLRRFDSLTAKGRIYGDERWLVGEDADGHINVLRF